MKKGEVLCLFLPKGDQFITGEYFENKAEFINLCNHLRRCIVNGSNNQLLEVYNDTIEEHRRSRSLLTAGTPVVMRSTEREQAMFA